MGFIQQFFCNQLFSNVIGKYQPCRPALVNGYVTYDLNLDICSVFFPVTTYPKMINPLWAVGCGMIKPIQVFRWLYVLCRHRQKFFFGKSIMMNGSFVYVYDV